jgi:ectoine hydroxylase-related dioxygenase (phytanoyl-CoA dioxygenase family)
MSALNFQNDGLEIVKAFLTRAEIEEIRADIDLENEKLRKYGIRNLEKRFASIGRLKDDVRLLKLANDLLGRKACFVRALFFDKTLKKNWLVTWHQDRTVTLNRRHDEVDWGPWSVKDGVCHVQPPIAVLESMITFRLHLDSADDENGCLEVVPGSHNLGLLEHSAIVECVRSNSTAHCVVSAGDAVLMRPLLLHRSRKAKRPSHRRVVHLDFSCFELPNGVLWA